MFNLLVVDDEPEMACGLAYDIDWTDIGISEVFKAYSAPQAMEILKKTRIDIVISDIAMPGINGIEMANMIRQEWPFSKIIFASGHDEFEYAQKAIELGVVGYIVKPVAYEEIKKLVKQAINEVERDLEKARLVDTAERQLEDLLPVIQERYLNSWIVLGKTNPLVETEKLRLSRLKIRKEVPAFLIAIRLDEVGKNYYENGMLEVEIHTICREVLLKSKHGIFFKDLNDHQLILVQSENEQSLAEEYRYVEGMAENLQYTVEKSLGCTISIFWGNVTTIDRLGESYKRLLERMQRRITWSPGVIMGPGAMEYPAPKIEIRELYESPSIFSLIEALQEEQVIKKLERIFSYFESGMETSHESLLEVYNLVSGALIHASQKRGIGISRWSGSDEKHFYNFEQIRFSRELKQWCLNVVKKYMEYMNGQEHGQNHILIEQAKKIIGDSLSKELRLSEIASYLYIHPNYLSRLFKEEEGIGISEYIIKLRVSKAKEYLEQPGMKVYEVSEKVGYESIAFFNRIFKRECGMSPKEYQTNKLQLNTQHIQRG